MDEKQIWEQIGCSFVQHYYQLFDSDRTQLKAIYTDASCLTWEGQQYQGKDAIIEKLSMLPFQKIQHSITSQDHQPTPDNCIVSMVVGQLKVLINLPQYLSIASGCHQTFTSLDRLAGLIFEETVSQIHKADDDPVIGFHQMFLLKNVQEAWVCTNDMFRLALHNFG